MSVEFRERVAQAVGLKWVDVNAVIVLKENILHVYTAFTFQQRQYFKKAIREILSPLSTVQMHHWSDEPMDVSHMECYLYGANMFRGPDGSFVVVYI